MRPNVRGPYSLTVCFVRLLRETTTRRQRNGLVITCNPRAEGEIVCQKC